MPTIPDHLLTFDAARWMPHVEPRSHIPILRAREKWRQAQDAWGHENRIWRLEFEQLRDQQLKERQ